MNQLLDECSRFRDEMGEVSDYITLGTALETIWSGIAGQHVAAACLMQQQRSWHLTCSPHSSQVVSVPRFRQPLFSGQALGSFRLLQAVCWKWQRHQAAGCATWWSSMEQLPVLQLCKPLTVSSNAARAVRVTCRLSPESDAGLAIHDLSPAHVLQALRLPSACPEKASVPAAQTQSSLSR